MDGFHHLLFRNSYLQGIRLVLALLDAATRSPDPPGGKGWKMWKNIWENPGKMSQNLGSKSAEKNAGTGYSVWTILEPTC